MAPMTVRRAASVVAFVAVTLLWDASAAKAVTGNQWKRWPQSDRSGYVMGVLDAWNGVSAMLKWLDSNANVKGQPILDRGMVEEALTEHTGCLAAQKMTYGQIVAIVDRWMAANPEQWHYEMSFLVFNAASETCKKLK